MKAILGILAIALLVFVAAFLLRPAPAQNTPAPEPVANRFDNPTYGYSFLIPENLEVEPYTPEAVSVGTRTEGGFSSVADIAVHSSGEDHEYESADAFIAERVRTLCAADGPDESIDCTEIASRTEYTSPSGMVGEELMLTLVRRTLSTGATATSSYGPVYAFTLGASALSTQHSALLIYPPLPAYLAGVSVETVRDVAGSLTIGQ